MTVFKVENKGKRGSLKCKFILSAFLRLEKWKIHKAPAFNNTCARFDVKNLVSLMSRVQSLISKFPEWIEFSPAKKSFIELQHNLHHTRPKELLSYMEAIINIAIDPIITIDEQGIMELLNPAAYKLFGYKPGELLGKNVSVLMPPPHGANHDAYLDNYRHTGHAKIIGIGREVNGMAKDGELIPVRIAVNETSINGKRIFVGTLHDLRNRKRAEQQILQLNEELEQKVKRRTEELADVVNKLLEANQKMLHQIEERTIVEKALRRSEAELKASLDKEKELSQMKSRFVSMASHEFRTPLSAILSSADLIEAYTKEPPDDKRYKHVERIRSSVNNLTSILNDFLSLSKLEENKVQLNPSKFLLEDFCREIIDEIKYLLKPGQEIQHAGTTCNASLYLDKALLKNVMYNLLSNASKYSPPGKSISCEAEVTEQALRITIADQGIGIPKKDQPSLFTRFHRAQNAENIQGTGLGLNIVKRYLDIMDGDITFESELDHGTTFYVTIPLPPNSANKKTVQ
jgi:two-component system, LuxR family, sensor kinase FixL